MRTVEIGICPTGIVCLRANQVLCVLIQPSQGLAEEEVFHPAGNLGGGGTSPQSNSVLFLDVDLS